MSIREIMSGLDRSKIAFWGSLGGFSLLASVASTPAGASIAVSQMIIELKPGSSPATDIEIVNVSSDRSFIVVEPREIIRAGNTDEKPFFSPDPDRLGLLVSPNRLVLEPNQRRTLRIAAIHPASDRERVYRVTVKPVTGEVSGAESGLKLLVGYDLLVLVRPASIHSVLQARRDGQKLVITNKGNSSVELSDGKQCDQDRKSCRSLPSKRLYAGVSWEQSLTEFGAGEYRVRGAEGWTTMKF